MQSHQKKINYKKIPMEVCLQCSTKIIRVSSLEVFEQNIPFKINARYKN